MSKKLFNIVLYAPEIPGNTGSIGRTCLALNLQLILIRPYGFEISEKAVRRAGLDYWKHLDITEYENWEEFLKKESPQDIFLFTKKAKNNHFSANFKKDSYLVFGSESEGLPEDVLTSFKDNLYRLPIYSEHVRSLNLSNAMTAAAYEALRQISFS